MCHFCATLFYFLETYSSNYDDHKKSSNYFLSRVLGFIDLLPSANNSRNLNMADLVNSKELATSYRESHVNK